MVQFSSAVAALVLAASSAEAMCYNPLKTSGFRSFSGVTGGGRYKERNHVTNMCKGYTNGSVYHRDALQGVCVPFL
jgi:hypothetical protein